MEGTPAVTGMAQEVRQEQRLMPVPLLRQLLRLVPLPAAEVERLVHTALDTNPCLSRVDGWSCPGCGRHLPGRRCPTCAASGGSRASAGSDVGRSRDGDPSAHGATGDWRAALAQAAALELTGAARAAVAGVVSHLDGRGLLPDEPAAVARACGTTEAAVADVLAALRAVGPPGIAARSPLDCVRRQCHQLVSSGRAPAVLAVLADDHLEAVAAGDTAAVAARIGCGQDEVAAALAVLRARVRPHPLLDAPPAPPVRPDLVIRWQRDTDGRRRLAVDVADARWHGLRVADDLVDPTGWAAPHQAAALDLLRQIDARASILRSIGLDLVAHQRAFLVSGRGHRPLRRAETAQRLGVHPSTVGRAVSHKWLLGPTGRLVPLAHCFGAATGPLDELARLLADHPAASDRALADLLHARGHNLARRTVAKYRSSLGAPPRHPSPPRAPRPG